MLVFWILSYSSSAPSSVDCDNWTEKTTFSPIHVSLYKKWHKFEILTQNYEKTRMVTPFFYLSYRCNSLRWIHIQTIFEIRIGPIWYPLTLSWGTNVKTAHMIGVFIVYIGTGSSMPISPSKSRDLADENNFFLTEWKWFETTVLFSSRL
jgi:hypothetical protein